MEDDQTSLRSTDAKQWERPWNTSEIRENSANWTLAGDTGLLHFLQEYAHNLLSRTHETEKLVNELVCKNKAISAKVNNVINDFQMLSNEQFIENRVYDEEIASDTASTAVPEIQKTKEQREAEMIPRVTEALSVGLSVLDQAFHRIQVEETSDSEEDEYRVGEGRIVLEPKDPYEHRPLPFIIGSTEFHQDDFVGLRDLYVEDVVEKLTDEESASIVSVSSSSLSLNESDVETETPYPKGVSMISNDYGEETQLPRNVNRHRSSESEGSDLFEVEKEEDSYTSNFEAEERMLKENEQNKKLNSGDLMEEVKSAIRNKIEPYVAKVPETSKQEKYDDDLFGVVESDDLTVENSPFQKKSYGLFSSDLAFTNGKDDLSDDDDLFGTKEKNDISSKSATIIPQAVAPSKETKAPDLFGESEDEREDIFTSLSSSKKSFSVSQPSSAILKDEQNQTAKTPKSITPVPNPVKRKSNNAFTEFNDKSNLDSLFGVDSASDDLFFTKSEKKSNTAHFMEDDDEDDTDLFSSLKVKSVDSLEPKKVSVKEQKKEQPSYQSEKSESVLFGGDDDDDDLDFFGSAKMPSVFSSPSQDNKQMFKADDAVLPNSVSSSKVVSLTRIVPVTEDPEVTDFLSKKHSSTINTTKDSNYINSSVPVKQPSDRGNIGSSNRDTSSVDHGSSQEILTNKKLQIIENQVGLSVSFDEPVDSHSILNAINKGRAKIPGKRRKPSRKARHASSTAESSDPEIEDSAKKPTEAHLPVQSGISLPVSDSDLLDSAVSDATLSDLQITPKKVAPFGIGKNIMSQLVSEISTSQVGKKFVAPKPSDSFEDDDENFFSPASGDQSSSETFDFPPVAAKQPTLGETSHTPPVVKAKVTENQILGSDSTLEEDLFSEPAFKGFRTSVSGKDSIFGLDDDDDDDDIFKVVEANKQKSSIPSAESSDDIFAYPEDDIFAGVAKEKYEMISNQLYEDDDDIFGNFDASAKQAISGSNTKKTSKVEAPKKEPVDIFDDPLTGFTSD